MQSAGPQSIDVPLWILWLRLICAAVAVAGVVIHYNLGASGRRKAKHAIARFFVRVGRENRLQRIQSAAKAVRSGFVIAFGSSGLRIALTSSVLSVVYFGLAFVVSGASAYDWKQAVGIKRALERHAAPLLFTQPPAEVERALEMRCIGRDLQQCWYKHDDSLAVAIRDQRSGFEKKYRELTAEHPEHSALTMLTLWEGTFLNSNHRMPLWIIGFNMLLDVIGVLSMIALLSELSQTSSVARMLLLAAAAAVVGSTLVSLSLYSYQALAIGDDMIFMKLFGLGMGSLAALSSAVGLWSTFARGDVLTERIKTALLSLVFGLIGFGALFTIVPEMPGPRFEILAEHSRDPLGSFFDLVALGTVVPTLLGAFCLALLVCIATFARALLIPTLIFLRTVLRMPTPVLITVTAVPAAVIGLVVSNWEDLLRMLAWN